MNGRLSAYRLSKPELAVLVSGVTSMGLEILAVRIIAPQFGSHIYTVGGILTVFLAALSLGYWQGGKRSALATNREMSWILLGTAVYVGVVIYASDVLLSYTSTLAIPPQYASLPAVIVLFGPPTYLLGFISPYAAELSTKEGTGEASGHVYALGTIGSIAGAAGTTFVLIPTLSTEMIGLLFGLSLVAAAVALTAPTFPRRSVVASVLIVGILLVAAGVGPVAFDHRGDVLYETNTAHQHMEIVEDGDVRTMYLDGQTHSAKDLADPDRHVFDYTRYFHLAMLAHENPEDVENVLFVGGGGYTGPQDFEARYDVDVDVVEIDPDVTDAAERYFGLEQGENLTAYENDGRQFLYASETEYDVIVLDAYKIDQVPFHLTTVEFMELVSDRLADDGVLQANVVSAPSGSAAAFYHAQYETMDQVFPDLYSFRTSNASAVQNVQVVATNAESGLDQDVFAEREAERDLGIHLDDAVDFYMDEPDTGDAPVLRDDRAAVDSLLDPMLGQHYVIEESESSEPEETAEPSIEGPIAVDADGTAVP